MSENTASAKAKDGEIVAEKKGGKKPQVTDPSFNMDELQALAALVNEHGFTDFEFENENIRVRLSKMTSAVQSAAATAVAGSVAAPVSSPATATAPATETASVDPDAGLYKITSPIVGTFYRSAGPDKDAYVSEGSNVSPDTTVCIVEAMKLMNEIQAEVSGEVVKIYVENGQPLFGIKK